MGYFPMCWKQNLLMFRRWHKAKGTLENLIQVKIFSSVCWWQREELIAHLLSYLETCLVNSCAFRQVQLAVQHNHRLVWFCVVVTQSSQFSRVNFVDGCLVARVNGSHHFPNEDWSKTELPFCKLWLWFLLFVLLFLLVFMFYYFFFKKEFHCVEQAPLKLGIFLYHPLGG